MALTLYTGTMNAGKTAALLNDRYAAMAAGLSTSTFCATNEYIKFTGQIESRVGLKAACLALSVERLKSHSVYSSSVIYVDECQWITHDHFEELLTLSRTHDVRCYGLRNDAAGNTFDGISWLMAFADRVVFLEGRCQLCGDPSVRHISSLNHTKYRGGYAAVCNKCHYEYVNRLIREPNEQIPQSPTCHLYFREDPSV